MNTQILTILTGISVKNPSSVIEQGFIGNDSDTASCLIKTFNIYSICAGVVLAIDRNPKNNLWCITVEVNSQRWVRYCNMATYKVSVGQKIILNDFLGCGYKGMMRLEYCTSEQSQFPVRILSKQLYKHDPTPIIFGQELLTGDF